MVGLPENTDSYSSAGEIPSWSRKGYFSALASRALTQRTLWSEFPSAQGAWRAAWRPAPAAGYRQGLLPELTEVHREYNNYDIKSE